MKLYTTIKSERAYKGQGGNKRLDIDILIDNREKPAYKIEVVAEGKSRKLIMLDNWTNEIVYQKHFTILS